jgi:hypothetical protein
VSKKGDARIARAIADEVNDKQKSARLVARILADLPKERTPRASVNVNSIYDMKMTWTIAHADREGHWSWGPRNWSQDAWDAAIAPKLRDFQTMLWREIHAATTGEHHSHHDMPIESICEECQTRLLELEKVDDDIFRFRLGNRRRLWGFRVLQEFEILWYDPEHKVYPTDPD